MPLVFTIGHSTRSLEAFVELLEAHGAALLAALAELAVLAERLPTAVMCAEPWARG